MSTAGIVSTLIDEWEGKKHLMEIGLSVPEGCIADITEVSVVAEKIGFPVVVKMVGKNLEHKTDAGAIALNLLSCEEVKVAVENMRKDVEHFDPAAVSEKFLVEKMLEKPLAELLINIRTDPQFGMAMTLAAGGIMTALLSDAVTIILPTNHNELESALMSLKISKLFDVFRGSEIIDRELLVMTLLTLVEGVLNSAIGITEIEINPLFVYKDTVYAVDVLMNVSTGNSGLPLKTNKKAPKKIKQKFNN